MSSFVMSCNIANSDPSAQLGMEIWLNDVQIFNQDHVQQPICFEHQINDDDAEHELKFVLKGKLPEHTKIDESQQIVKDATLSITDLAFDQIKLGHLIVEKSVYTHNFNSTGPMEQHKFYGQMGCNGTVSLKFFTPMYLWLLENM